MFLADAAVQDLTIIGPHGLNHHIATMRTYLWRFVRTIMIGLCLP